MATSSHRSGGVVATAITHARTPGEVVFWERCAVSTSSGTRVDDGTSACSSYLHMMIWADLGISTGSLWSLHMDEGFMFF